MTNIQALREKIATLANQANHLLAEKGSATWTVEDQAKFDGYADEIQRARNQVAAAEKMRELDAEKFFENAAVAGGKTVEIDADKLTALAATALYMRFGNNVSPEMAAQIRNAMSTTTTTEGGYTVPSEIAAMVIDKMKAFGGMREVASIMTTAGGNSLNFPTSDGTSEVGVIVGENAAATTGDITFGTIALPVFKYSSNKIALPVELIQDSGIDVIAYVMDRLATRLARIQNTHFTVGAGTTVPDGIVPKAGLGKTGTTGQTLSVIYDDLVDLKHSVNRAYRSGAKFMMNDLSVAVVSKLKETTGRPIWEYSTQVGAPDTLLGHAVQINDDMAVMAASAKSIIFGDLSKYNIRDVANSTSMRRFDDSAFALNGQVGFCAWTRTGGNLLDVNAVKYYANSAT
jgi:HK97 family phage major capsid protein